MKKLFGISASPGISQGKVYLFDNSKFKVPKYKISEDKVDFEIARFNAAVADAVIDLEHLKASIESELASSDLLILDSHLLMLDDPELRAQVESGVRSKLMNVESVVFDVSKSMMEILNASGDKYLKERALDVSDVCKRIVNKLKSVENETLSSLEEDVILVSKNLMPSDTLSMDKSRVKGFATDMGGKTSHTAILARSFEIPAVVGIKNLSSLVDSDDYIIIDGNRGVVIINPTDEVKQQYLEYSNYYLDREHKLLSLNDLKAETIDGKHISLQGNIELPSDVNTVISHGADGIGLYRSEFLFMDNITYMDEEMQFKAYKSVLDAMGDRPVTIRTMDVGGDKIISALNLEEEGNPILGWRSIRFCLDQRDLFKIQLRALLRAGFNTKLRIMFPMISGASELDRVISFMDEVKQSLEEDNLEYNKDVPIGIMIEVPSAALTSDILAKKVDFFSIGTNDLIQYTIAVDRDNEKIAHLYDAFHPGVIRMLKIIIDNAHKEGIPVSMCGEMAGDVYASVVLLGLGLDVFSMSSVSIPEIKQIVRTTSLVDAEKLVGTILEMKSPEEINKFVKEWMNERYDIS